MASATKNSSNSRSSASTKQNTLYSDEPEFGYGGSGPAQTALAILADATGNDRLAVLLHQRFKWDFVAKAQREGFEMTAEEIQQWATERAKKLDLSAWDEEPCEEEGE